MHQLIGAKFCTVIRPGPNFIMPVQNLGEPSLKKIQGQKRVKFGAISDDFKVLQRIFLKKIKIFKIGQLFDLLRFLSR